MSIIQKEFHFLSSTGECTVFAVLKSPEAPKAVIQIHHGMAEHMGRYQDFIHHLCTLGYAVIIHDMANHGRSNDNVEDLGYFGAKNGWQALVEDMKDVCLLGKQACPNIPYVVFGHSMGSLVTRCFIAKYGNMVDGAVISGTVGFNPFSEALIAMTNAATLIKGKKFVTDFFDKVAFASYNDRFEKRTKFDWLTRENDIVDQYVADEKCGFLFTAQGYNDLAHLVSVTNTPAWYKAVPTSLPICLLSGDQDPCGDYGKGVTEVYKKLKASGHKVSMKLYGNARHEILNEKCRELVYEDIANWIENSVFEK